MKRDDGVAFHTIRLPLEGLLHASNGLCKENLLRSHGGRPERGDKLDTRDLGLPCAVPRIQGTICDSRRDSGMRLEAHALAKGMGTFSGMRAR